MQESAQAVFAFKGNDYAPLVQTVAAAILNSVRTQMPLRFPDGTCAYELRQLEIDWKTKKIDVIRCHGHYFIGHYMKELSEFMKQFGFRVSIAVGEDHNVLVLQF